MNQILLYIYFKYNQERLGEKTPLANVNIREAISKAFNKEDLTICSFSKWFYTSWLLNSKRFRILMKMEMISVMLMATWLHSM